MTLTKKIVVIGSSNIDMVAKVKQLPKPGETVGNADFIQVFGGKGANQAVAASRLGGEVTFVSSLGEDDFGAAITKELQQEGICMDYTQRVASAHTGTAIIMVDQMAENIIAVAPGANAILTVDRLQCLDQLLVDAEVVLLQAEIPIESIVYIAKVAKSKGVKVVLNPAPAFKMGAELLSCVDLLVVNETEAQFITGIDVGLDNLNQVATALQSMGVKNVVVTLGSDGVYALSGGREIRLPRYIVEAVDTTAAGDTFCGALAVTYHGELTKQDLEFASAASAISVTRYGAQPSIPYIEEVKKFMSEYKS